MRNGAELSEYLGKERYVGREIINGHLYKRPGMWCAWYDYLPVCLGNKQQANASLVTVP